MHRGQACGRAERTLVPSSLRSVATGVIYLLDHLLDLLQGEQCRCMLAPVGAIELHSSAAEMVRTHVTRS